MLHKKRKKENKHRLLNIFNIMPPPLRWSGVYCFKHVGMSVGRSVRRTNLVRSVTREFIVQGSSNLIWWLFMTSRWPLLNFGVSRSKVKVTVTFKLRGIHCFTNISSLFSYSGVILMLNSIQNKFTMVIRFTGFMSGYCKLPSIFFFIFISNILLKYSIMIYTAESRLR